MTERDAFGNPIEERHGPTLQPPATSPGAHPPAPQPAAAHPPASGPAPGQNDALVALIASISGFFFFPLVGSIVGIVFARRARRQIDAAGAGPRGMATAALVLGWLAIGLGIAFLGLIILGALVSGPETTLHTN